MTPIDTPPTAVKIFGREPAAWINLIEAGLFLLIAAFAGFLPFDGAEFAVLFMALVSAAFGGYTALATEDKGFGWATGFAKAGINLLLFFGLDLSPDLQAAILGFVAIATGFLVQRPQTSPVVDQLAVEGDGARPAL